MADAAEAVPGYDSLPLATLEHRIRSLTEDEVVSVIEYERAHADRTPVLEALRSRLNELRHGAEPSGGDQTETTDLPSRRRHDSPVDPSTAAEPSRPQRNAQPDQTPRPDRP